MFRASRWSEVTGAEGSLPEGIGAETLTALSQGENVRASLQEVARKYIGDTERWESAIYLRLPHAEELSRMVTRGATEANASRCPPPWASPGRCACPPSRDVPRYRSRSSPPRLHH
ncbi:MAG: hypothetical protein LBR22_08925 [Desulfovibrio sp.]|nr:hypothetical protein [Desulfovibrio sp.]